MKRWRTKNISVVDASNFHYVCTMDWKLHRREEPRNLDQGCEGEPMRIRSGIWGWSPKWGTHSGLFVYPNHAPVFHKPSQHSFCCFFTLFYERFHCLRVWGWQDCQASAPKPGYFRTDIMLGWRLCCGGFYWGSAVKSQSSRDHDYTGQPKSADVTTVSSFPHGDVVIQWNLNQPGFKFVSNAQRAAGCKIIWYSFHLLMFWPD